MPPAALRPPSIPISRNLMGSRSPRNAAWMIRRAIISVIGSLRSCKPSLFRAAENAVSIAFKCSGPNARLSPKNGGSARRAPPLNDAIIHCAKAKRRRIFS